MIKMFTVQEAKQTILRREMALEPEVPPALQARLDELFGVGSTPDTAVTTILHTIRQQGDTAVHHWTGRIDGVELATFAVDKEELATAVSRIPADLADALRFAAGRIRQFHSYQPLPNWTTTEMGGRLGQRVTPIQRVGVYVPGGTAPLPSSLLMGVIPAQVAGVPDIVATTPPGRNGRVPDVILAAAAIAGVETVYTLGGAQAIGALAFGTESIRRVDKIVGPGNLFVTLAKKQVYGIVGIDGLYGPTETVVVADETANPAWVAADMLAQAEHDVLATAILLTPSRELATAVQIEISKQLEDRSRADIIAVSLANQSGIVITADMDEACALASAFAAEHTCIASDNPQAWVDKIPHAGGLFIGERSFEVLGDYVAGPSHTMPTGGTARFASPLNVSDFVKISSTIELDDKTSALLSPIAARIAQAELLDGHAAAAKRRLGD
ncbi:MAG: histidinol dehydrogenase [Chloroflexi bacterium]|nr:histidinol dehydrogenase [Ardenticatenaceae bacterium]MBL1131351.1 histidinol dehydrogenase [Chloroflexota bacterium]NOG37453.1 histidinol dehydrogenase [Chloroflexota bacterium]